MKTLVKKWVLLFSKYFLSIKKKTWLKNGFFFFKIFSKCQKEDITEKWFLLFSKYFQSIKKKTCLSKWEIYEVLWSYVLCNFSSSLCFSNITVKKSKLSYCEWWNAADIRQLKTSRIWIPGCPVEVGFAGCINCNGT